MFLFLSRFLRFGVLKCFFSTFLHDVKYSIQTFLRYCDVDDANSTPGPATMAYRVQTSDQVTYLLVLVNDYGHRKQSCILSISTAM